MPSLAQLRLCYGTVPVLCAAALWAFDPGTPVAAVLCVLIGFFAANALGTSHALAAHRHRYVAAMRRLRTLWKKGLARDA